MRLTGKRAFSPLQAKDRRASAELTREGHRDRERIERRTVKGLECETIALDVPTRRADEAVTKPRGTYCSTARSCPRRHDLE